MPRVGAINVKGCGANGHGPEAAIILNAVLVAKDPRGLRVQVYGTVLNLRGHTKVDGNNIPSQEDTRRISALPSPSLPAS